MIQSKFNYMLATAVSVFTLVFVSNTVAAKEDIKVPFQYSLGVKHYQDKCASCHGQWGKGTEVGPPLMHPFYKPSHHNDASFYRAALSGVQAHHWNFGNMPAVKGITEKEVGSIISFIRWLQHEKGIF